MEKKWMPISFYNAGFTYDEWLAIDKTFKITRK
jgi:hypothetical protein